MANISSSSSPIRPATNEIISAAFQTFLDNTSDIMFVKNKDLVYVAASMPFVHMTGKEKLEEIVGRTDFEIFENIELAKRYTFDDRRLFKTNQNLINYIEPLTDSNGRPRYSSTSKFILRDPHDEVIGILGISRDITREYMSRQRYQRELKYLFELPADTYAALFLDIDDWRIIRHHRHEVDGHTVTICEDMKSFAENALRCIIEAESPEVTEFFKTLSRETLLKICNQGIRHHSLEYLRRMPNNDQQWVHVDINFLIDPETSHLCAMWSLKNIDHVKTEERKLHYAAEYDAMTGLLNRANTNKYILQTLEQDPNSCHALLAIDVDNFKSLNDTFGHQAGDTFLINLANVLKNAFRESDIIGRIGGDEFFIFMKNISSKEIISEKANKLLLLTNELCSVYENLDLSISAGISLYPSDGKTLEDLYAAADRALYQVKKHGKNHFQFASDSN